MHYFLSIIIKMCLANLTIITPTPSSTIVYPKTPEKNKITTYSCDQLIYLAKSQICNNLTGLARGSIRRIRDLWLNKKGIRIKHQNIRSTSQANLRNLRQVITTNEVKQHKKSSGLPQSIQDQLNQGKTSFLKP